MYLFHDPGGAILYTVITRHPPPGDCIEVPDETDLGDLTAWRVIDGQLVAVEPTPEEAHAAAVAGINAERDRRLPLPFAFGGHRFDRDPVSLQRITGAAALAGFAMGAGAQPGDLFWHGGAEPFSWITADNGVVQMDAPTVFAFGQAAAAVETGIVFACRALKDMTPIPEDYADDRWWP